VFIFAALFLCFSYDFLENERLKDIIHTKIVTPCPAAGLKVKMLQEMLLKLNKEL
jgi:hypothetical protein